MKVRFDSLVGLCDFERQSPLYQHYSERREHLLNELCEVLFGSLRDSEVQTAVLVEEQVDLGIRKHLHQHEMGADNLEFILHVEVITNLAVVVDANF